MSGDLLSIQLKSKQKINWLKKTPNKSKIRIKRETAQYWFNSVIPVFLLVVDISTKQVYHINTKRQMRQNFNSLFDKKYFTFELNKQISLAQKEDVAIFFLLYLLEKRYKDYSHHLTDLVLNWKDYNDFIALNTGRDFFMLVDDEPKLKLHQFYYVLKSVYEQLFIKWDIKNIDVWYEEDRKNFNSPKGDLHEATITNILAELYPIFIETLRAAYTTVLETESSYWLFKSKELYNYCYNNFDLIKKLDKNSIDYFG